jgi:quercetin dioxygenase-like cupin family protein
MTGIGVGSEHRVRQVLAQHVGVLIGIMMSNSVHHETLLTIAWDTMTGLGILRIGTDGAANSLAHALNRSVPFIGFHQHNCGWRHIMLISKVRRVAICGGLAISLTAFSSVSWIVPAVAQQVQRKILLTQDLPIPGYEMVSVAVEIPPAGREGRHTHPGAVMGYVQEGVLTLDDEGRPTATYKAGDSFFVKAGNIHEGSNHGTATVKVIATFVVEKGKPLTTLVQ